MGNSFTVTIRVSRIIYMPDESEYCIFVGETLVPYKKKAGFKKTGETHVYSGSLRHVMTEDVFELVVEERQTKHGERRFISGYKRLFPGTLRDIANYLTSRRKGVGERRSKAIIDKWGLDTISEIVNNPNALDGLGIPKKQAAALRAEVLEEKVFEDLMSFLQVHKLNHQLAVPVFNEYGSASLDMLRANPYAAYLSGTIDFCTADFLFLYFGGKLADQTRLSMGIVETLRRDTRRNGNLYTSRQVLTEKLSCTLKERGKTFTDSDITSAISALTAKDMVAVDTVSGAGTEAIYLTDNFRAETKGANRIAKIMRTRKTYEFDAIDVDFALKKYQRALGLSLADEQLAAVSMALSSPVSIITGGPGTGKSQTITMIMNVAREIEPNIKIRLAAPTGKAANRMSELCNYPAKTMHRMLGLGDGYLSEVGEGELSGDIVIVDEYSMVDAELNYKLFRALDPNSRLVLVGDYDQIPSVGPGLILRDLINSGCIPCTRFTKVFRQAEQSKIIANANRIIGKSSERKLTISRTRNGDFLFTKELSAERILEDVIAAVQEQMSVRGLAAKDVQVLSPLKAPEVGIRVLNNRLQEALNPNGASLCLEDKEFRVGDKVIHVVNNYKKEVFNGETGIVKSIDYLSAEILTVAYPDKEVSYTIQELETELELAYAISIHKAQGSEFPVVILPVHPCLASGYNRNILYTAITRAKTAIHVIGDPETLVQSIARDGNEARNSFLKQRLQRHLPPASTR